MKAGRILSGAVLLCLIAGAPAFADVQVTMQNGRVSVVAKDATLRQILTEWARVGQAKVVNVERVPGAPMTIELREMPEAQALQILLRSLSGYMAAPRAAQAPNLSRFDRIVVMPTVAAALKPATAGAPPPPVFQQPQPMATQVIQTADPNDDDDRQPPNPPVQNPGVQRPVFTAFPQPQVVVNPNLPPPTAAQPNNFTPPPGMQMPGGEAETPPPPPPSAFPTAAPGVSVPGMVVPAPQQPGTTPPPVRRPGGRSGA
jgi:hypothetical protein